MTVVEKRPRRFGIFGQLWFQVLIGTLIGVLLGWLAPATGTAMKPFGDAFIKLIRMMIGPIIFVTVVHGIAGMRDMRSVGRLALKSLIYFEAITILALIVGLVAVDLWQPGTGMNIDPASLDGNSIKNYVNTAHDQSISAYLMNIIPTTLVSAFTEAHVLQVLFVSVLFGVGLAAIGERGEPVMRVIEATSQTLFRVIGYVMYFAPIGAFGAIAFTVGQFGADSLMALGELIIEFFMVCALFTVLVLGTVCWWCGVSLWRLLMYIRDEIVIVAATTSTETVLPRLIEKMKKLGCEEGVVGFVIPAGYSFNLDGTCLYLTTVAVFLAQATNTPLTVWHELGLIAVLLLTSKGAAGVAGAAFVVLAATLSTTGTIPVASIALILGIHRILAEGLTFVNLVGNSVATIVIAKWEDKLDHAVLAEYVGNRALRRRHPVAVTQS
ncbi:C4-dicarboxylate transporter DctA [Xanthomonas sp. CFBP 8703]|jgi:aerobic C4-dicarboxylate transport protein|uniref:C4-dicarboxylate transporter DctA n=1 Tax=Xanthomonas bonasiae TaxID=2810351 RepID=A0ABS3B2G4_9XANT|nr:MULTISPECIES: C4-dicarboxylate transporter DctA [Xanthomonas]MBN6102401.1 C4-dicarboxylate transporter DctA [Xanthomonas bonasiae]MBN6112772.1 C4-dicarboxylate transporter DctA [Xanthomonas bonasiae]NYF22096.1 aerobic C4-dicarboxylate transport protein [Xanthomonas sp. JAI131]